MVMDERRAGILLHPTSLPGQYGIGDLGDEAYRFLDWMHSAGLAWWQVLPLGPTSFGDSPYQCFSAFAGNPLLVSPEYLVRDGLLEADEIEPPDFPNDRVDFGWIINWKLPLLRRAHERFRAGAAAQLRPRFEAFCLREDVARWLDDYALFMALKDSHSGRPWNTWEPDLCQFKEAALEPARKEYADDIAYHRFAQFLFFHQWEALRAAGRERGIRIIGDAPIYVAYDSADTWAHQKLFELDSDGNPERVAGVPPDYFSATGQLWGNPLYHWSRMARDKYAWWIARLRSIFALVDIVRLDHFRGFMGYYAVPFGNETAEHGEWVKGPGKKFFDIVAKEFGDLPIIAEDLGEITVDVPEVRHALGLPGMAILQFAWVPASLEPLIPDPNSGFLPHVHERNSVVYTGTHDNDTTVGWWRHTSTPGEHHLMQVYLSTDGNLPHWDLIRAAFGSVANSAIIPVQDFLGLDSEARMNFPGKPEGNWTWRLLPRQLSSDLAEQIRQLTLIYERCANPPKPAQHAPPKVPSY